MNFGQSSGNFQKSSEMEHSKIKCISHVQAYTVISSLCLIIIIFCCNAGSPPEMKTEPSTYITDFKKIMDDNGNADILFKFEDGSQGISAHKIVLWLTSSIFRDVLQDQSMSDIEYYKDLFEVIDFSDDPQPSLDDSVDLKTCVRARTCIVLKNWISQEIFVKILEFCYTGEAGISKDTEQSTIKELLTASEKLKVQSLAAICSYFLKPIDPKKDDNQQNLTDSSHAKKKLAQPTSPPRDVLGLFLDKEASVFSDLTFRVDDTLVYAHKAILVARSPVLAALLSENFLDGKSSQVHFNVKFQSVIGSVALRCLVKVINSMTPGIYSKNIATLILSKILERHGQILQFQELGQIIVENTS